MDSRFFGATGSSHRVRDATTFHTLGLSCGAQVGLSEDAVDPGQLSALVASLAGGHPELDVRLRRLIHSVASQDDSVRLHGHYFAFRQGQATVAEFVEFLSTKLISFCLPRSQVDAAFAKLSGAPPAKVMEGVVTLQNKAVDLFKRAQKNTNRNGEFGEVITYVLIEAVLNAPQLVAKMSLKTSPQMPVHGSDGIHFSFDEASGGLTLIWGESKCYASVTKALAEAVKSVAENLRADKLTHEIFLIEQHADLAAFPEAARKAILSFLDPYDENSNKRVDASVILVAFDFAKFAKLNGLKPQDVEPAFERELQVELDALGKRLDAELKKHGIQQHSLDVFFLPVPSVKILRALFQDRIGWAA